MDQIVERLDRDGGKFSTLVTGVIESAPFQRQRRAETVAASHKAAIGRSRSVRAYGRRTWIVRPRTTLTRRLPWPRIRSANETTCRGASLVAEPAAFSARLGAGDRAARLALAVAALGSSGRDCLPRPARPLRQSPAAAADGVRHDSQRRAPGQLVADRQGQRFRARPDDGAARRCEGPDSSHLGLGPHQCHGRPGRRRRPCAGQRDAAHRLPRQENGRLGYLMSARRSTRSPPSTSAISRGSRRSN